MKQFNACVPVLALFAWGAAHALPADHPANPDAAVPVFQPADYFVSPAAPARLAADEHRHDAAPAAAVPATQGEAGTHEPGAGKGKEGGGMGMECMKMHGDAGMHDCPMMKKGMPQEGDKPAAAPEAQQPKAGKPEAGKDEGHESHH